MQPSAALTWKDVELQQRCSACFNMLISRDLLQDPTKSVLRIHEACVVCVLTCDDKVAVAPCGKSSRCHGTPSKMMMTTSIQSMKRQRPINPSRNCTMLHPCPVRVSFSILQCCRKSKSSMKMETWFQTRQARRAAYVDPHDMSKRQLIACIIND